MKTYTTLALSLALCAFANAQNSDKDDPAAGAPDPAALAAYMKLIEPGPEHKELARGVGTWDMKQTFFMPGVPQTPFDGVATTKPVLGGRYFVTEAKMSSFMGPYSGIGTSAYDKVNKRYVYTWMDTMGTGMMISYGKKKDDGTVEYLSEPQLDPMSGMKLIFRMAFKMESDDKMNFDMFSKPADGSAEEAKMMNITYTRKK